MSTHARFWFTQIYLAVAIAIFLSITSARADESEEELLQLARTPLIFLKGDSIQEEDLRMGRSSFFKLVIKERGISRRDYFEKVIFPKIALFEDSTLATLKLELREFFYELEAKKRRLNDLEWQIYLERNAAKFSKIKLPKGRDFSTEILMAFDEEDGGLVPVHQSREEQMQTAQLDIELVAADLHLALFLWGMRHRDYYAFNRKDFRKTLPKLVAHLLSEETGEEVVYWYEHRNEDEAPLRKPVRMSGYQLVGFVADGPDQKTKIEERLKGKCDDWKAMILKNMSPPRSQYISDPVCTEMQVAGTRWNGQMEQKVGTDGYLHDYPVRESGQILSLSQSVEFLPGGHFQYFKQTIYGPIQNMVRSSQTFETRYEDAAAEYEQCNDFIRKSYALLGEHAFFGFCDDGYHGHGTASMGDRTFANGHLVNENIAGWVTASVVSLVIRADQRILSERFDYATSGRFPWGPYGYVSTFGDLNRAYLEMDHKYAKLEERFKKRYPDTFLIGAPYLSEGAPARKMSDNQGPEFTISGTAIFFRLSRPDKPKN